MFDNEKGDGGESSIPAPACKLPVEWGKWLGYGAEAAEERTRGFPKLYTLQKKQKLIPLFLLPIADAIGG